jgi:hypothetical protein
VPFITITDLVGAIKKAFKLGFNNIHLSAADLHVDEA